MSIPLKHTNVSTLCLSLAGLGGELEPTKTTSWGICGTSLLQAGRGQAGRLTDVLCLLWTVCVWACRGESFYFCLINFVFSSSLTGTCTPPEAEHCAGGAGAACSGDPKSHLLTQHPCECCEWGKVHLQLLFFPPLFSLSQPKCSFALLDHIQMLMEAVGAWMQFPSHLTAPKAGLPPSPGIWVSKPLIPLEKCCTKHCWVFLQDEAYFDEFLLFEKVCGEKILFSKYGTCPRFDC